jgi:hypothetical protein
MSFHRSTILLALALFQGLLDVAVAIYATRGFEGVQTELFASALSRSQICLLAVWFALGSERLSWRFCGLIAGSCLVFVLFSRMTFTFQDEIGPGGIWREVEWNYYFRATGPGDLLVKLPMMISGISVPLFVLRLRNSAKTALPENRSEGLRWPPLQFRLQDVIIWVIAISILLATFFQTGPYPGWYQELGEHWMQHFRLQERAAIYTVATALVYVAGTFASLWSIYGRGPLGLRISLGSVLTLAAAYAVDPLRPKIAGEVSSESSSEMLTCGMAVLTMVATFALFKVYNQYFDVIASTRCRPDGY